MAVTITTFGADCLRRITLSAVANDCTRVDVPEGTLYIMVKTVGASTLKVAFTGTDNTPISANYLSVTSNTLVYIPTCGNDSVYLASPVASAIVAVMPVGGMLGDIG